MKPYLKNGKPFIIPKNIDLNKSGIYKISFDDYFYIGSTSNFKKRINCFRGMGGVKGSGFNKKMFECGKSCSVITFEILQVVEDVSLLREIETEFIKQFIGNPLLINRAFDAKSNKGISWTEEERSKISKNNKGKSKVKSPSGIIEKYSINGDFISSYTSCMMAGKDSGMSHKMVAAILKGEKPNHNGFTFLRIIEPPKPKKQPTYGKGRKLTGESLERFRAKKEAWRNSPNYTAPKLSVQAKTVIQFDLEGNKVNEFPAISFAANHVGSSRKAFTKSVKESKRNYHKGYIWKYA